MADKLVDYATRSLVHHIETYVSVDDAYIVTPDFDWNRKPDPSDPGNQTVARGLPYAAIHLVGDLQSPWSVSANILYQSDISVEMHLCAGTYTSCVQSTSDVKQTLHNASSVVSGVGITLYDFDTPSGGFYTAAGTLQVETQGTEYSMAESQDEESNIKFRSVTPVSMTAFRDVTATLLENKGRINLTDS
jgi:hypothetical protein